MVRRYDTRQEITRDALAHVLDDLEASPCRYLHRSGLFTEQELDFAGEPEVIEQILTDLEYQEEIARAALQLRDTDYGESKLNSYHWEIGVDAVGLVYRQKYASIDLVLEPADPALNRVLFPAIVVKCKRGGFKYWGVMNIDEALGTVHLLLET